MKNCDAHGGYHTYLHDRLITAFVRRMKLDPAHCEISNPRPGVHRITCEHTGSWIDFDTTGWRIRRIAECELEDAS